MTTIACNLTEMAGDRQFTYGGSVKYAGKTKIYEFTNDFAKQFDANKVLVGFCGELTCIPDAMYYMQDGGKVPRVKGIELLLLTDRQTIWWGTNFRDWTEIDKPYWAIGSGMPFALPVLATGGSPSEAVNMAAEFDPNTGMGVTSFSLA